ncbi:MAG: aromatic ring-hydroxylating dioxygenase subunit alpha [Candidatus Lustribacter sp.]|jgi:phenylpropionate dioxygenase-like ring-hydroxylating dioxygenase large terminal subunit
MPKYVDPERGLISREIFVDEEVYRLEQERIFCKQWLFIGHASQVPEPGDYFQSRMGEENVIMVRAKDGGINVFLNSCRHRGMKVCRYDAGNAAVFTCPYHGWSYGLNGDLIGVPRFKDVYYGELDRSQYGLLAARVCNHRGMVWATWNFTGPDFYEFMGEMLQFHDSMLEPTDGGDGEMEVLPGVQKWVVPCNWKFPGENSIGDHYHGVSHVSVELVGIGPGGRGSTRHGDGGYRPLAMTAFPKTGHGSRGGKANPDAVPRYPFPAFSDPATEAWHRAAWERHQVNRPGERPAWDRLGNGGNIFPNMNYHTRWPRTIMVAHPQSPTTCEMWRWFLVDKDMPFEVKQFVRAYFLRYSGPGGLTEQDDMENWAYATIASQGAMARKLPYNVQQGLGHAVDSDAPIKGARYSGGFVSESSAMVFYNRWQELMDQTDPSVPNIADRAAARR